MNGEAKAPLGHRNNLKLKHNAWRIFEFTPSMYYLVQRLYYISCPQHFHNHNFNEVNLFKIVDQGIYFFSFLPICGSILWFLSVSHRGRRVSFFFFHNHSLPPSHLPRLQVLVLSFPIRLPELCSRPLSLCLLSPQRQSNKGLGRRKTERETVKGKRWRWWLERVVVVVVVVGRRAVKVGWKQCDTKGDGWREWERQSGRGRARGSRGRVRR